MNRQTLEHALAVKRRELAALSERIRREEEQYMKVALDIADLVDALKRRESAEEVSA